MLLHVARLAYRKVSTTTSLTIPAGAVSWNSDINPGMPFFAYQVLVEGVYDYECTPHGFVGNFTAINTGIETPEVNNNFKIYAVQPSIYNLSFTLTHSADVKVIVYDLTGKSAKVLASSLYTAGEYLNTYNLEELRKGIYLIEMRIDNQRISKRLIID